ncbi:MAG TPA: urease accessory protein UreD [Mesorhizobium sp.]|nr:urease accessory protein UreD [Mesorhizobium sp.]
MTLDAGALNVAEVETDAAGPALPPRHQRASGAIRASFRRRGAETLVHRLFQDGSAKLRLPRMGPGDTQAVLINTAGGLTGGDGFANALALDEGAALTVTTQACERIYRSNMGEAEVRTNLSLGAQARLDWLPQETILFDGGRLRRFLEADLAPSSTLLATEALVFGRQARGEKIRAGLFRDRWRIRREGKLVFADDLSFEGDMAADLLAPALLNGAGALATVLLVAPDAEDQLAAVRERLGDLFGGASAWDGKLVARMTAPDGFALRRRLLPVLEALRHGRPIPKLWQL